LITVPTLLIAAGKDEVVESTAIESLGKRMRSGSSLLIAGARHEIMMERDLYKGQLMAAFDAFVPGDQT